MGFFQYSSVQLKQIHSFLCFNVTMATTMSYPAAQTTRSCRLSKISRDLTLHADIFCRGIHFIINDFFYLNGCCCWVAVSNVSQCGEAVSFVVSGCSLYLLCMSGYERVWCPATTTFSCKHSVSKRQPPPPPSAPHQPPWSLIQNYNEARTPTAYPVQYDPARHIVCRFSSRCCYENINYSRFAWVTSIKFCPKRINRVMYSLATHARYWLHQLLFYCKMTQFFGTRDSWIL